MATVTFKKDRIPQNTSREGSFWTDGLDVFILAQTGPGLFAFISLSNGNRYKEPVEFDNLDYSFGTDWSSKTKVTRVVTTIEIEP